MPGNFLQKLSKEMTSVLFIKDGKMFSVI